VEIRRLDRQLVQGSEGDDTWHWDELRKHCLRVAFRYTRNPGEAEDIAQESLLRAWAKRSTLRDSSRRRQWVGAIVRNEAFRQLGRRRPEPVETVETWHGADDERVLATAERADLQVALGRLNKRDRQLVRLRYDEDLTQEGIARRLGIPVGTVKVRLHRVRAKLRSEIETV
jgi:RNA polymerase sigma-70 factor (ECF subfamily)